MKRLALFALVTLVASAVEARDRRCRPSGNRTQDCDSYAFFEAFPASGAGTTGPCSTTTPTGAKGETVTTTRASTATCQATAAGGMVDTGIADGDLRTLSSGVLRQEYDRDGVLGVCVESSRTNSTLRSREWSNAAWAEQNDISTPIVITADAATAPDGTSTADRAQSAATTAVQYAVRYQAAACPAGVTATASDYVRGVSGSGTTDIYVLNGSGTYGAVPCSFVADSWTRCTRTVAVGAGPNQIGAGNASEFNGGTARSASDFYVWQGQCEAGTTASSAIPTTSATVTRAADVVSLPVTLSGSTFTAAISYDAPALVSGATAFQVYVDSDNSVTATVSAAGKLTCTFRIGGSDSTVTTTAGLTANSVNRVACTYGDAGRSACIGGTCDTTSGALTMPTGAATFYLGTRSSTGNEANGVLSRACYDPTRCL